MLSLVTLIVCNDIKCDLSQFTTYNNKIGQHNENLRLCIDLWQYMSFCKENFYDELVT